MYQPLVMTEDRPDDIKARVRRRVRVRPEERLIFDHVRLRGADFSKRKVLQLSSVGSRFESCRFDGSRIEGASFGSGGELSEYLDSTFDRCRIRFDAGDYFRFVRCSFTRVELRDWISFRGELVDCVFTGRLKTAIFNGTVPEEDQARLMRTQNEFHDNDFSGAELVNVTFRTGIDLTKQRLPTGNDYFFLENAGDALIRARSKVLRWTQLEERRRALAFIQALKYEVEGGQRQVFVRRDDFPGSRDEALRFFDLLG